MPNQTQGTAFRVIDAMDGPHRGRILRLRLQGGTTPSLRSLKGASILARSPSGEEERLKIVDFFIPGGRPSEARFGRTGRIDVVVEAENGSQPPQVATLWEVIPA
jgi:hypothetical protein